MPSVPENLTAIFNNDRLSYPTSLSYVIDYSLKRSQQMFQYLFEVFSFCLVRFHYRPHLTPCQLSYTIYSNLHILLYNIMCYSLTLPIFSQHNESLCLFPLPIVSNLWSILCQLLYLIPSTHFGNLYVVFPFFIMRITSKQCTVLTLHIFSPIMNILLQRSD